MLGISSGIMYKDYQTYLPPSSYSMSFDGTDDFLAFTATSFPIELTGEDLSISFWCKRTDNNDEACVLGHSGTDDYSRINFDDDGNALKIESDQNGDFAESSVTDDTDWHHYVITSVGKGTGSGGLSQGTDIMYEDGAAVLTVQANFGKTHNKDFTVDRIGSDEGSSTTEFKGLIYQLAIFDIALAANVVTAIYNNSTPIPIHGMDSLLHLWTFSEGSGSTTADSVGSLTATLNGNAAFSSTTP